MKKLVGFFVFMLYNSVEVRTFADIWQELDKTWSMSKLSEEAFAIMAMCPEARKPYGITVDKGDGNNYVFHWAFPIDKEKAHREGYDAKSVHGTISYDAGFPGCPYCGSRNYVFCGNCGGVVCYHGQRRFTCPICGYSGTVTYSESVDLKGGGF